MKYPLTISRLSWGKDYLQIKLNGHILLYSEKKKFLGVWGDGFNPRTFDQTFLERKVYPKEWEDLKNNFEEYKFEIQKILIKEML